MFKNHNFMLSIRNKRLNGRAKLKTFEYITLHENLQLTELCILNVISIKRHIHNSPLIEQSLDN